MCNLEHENIQQIRRNLPLVKSGVIMWTLKIPQGYLRNLEYALPQGYQCTIQNFPNNNSNIYNGLHSHMFALILSSQTPFLLFHFTIYLLYKLVVCLLLFLAFKI